MKRVGAIASLACVFALAGGGTAAADFDNLCSNTSYNPPKAGVNLAVNYDFVYFTGSVTCYGADSISVAVTLTSEPDGTVRGGPRTASCTTDLAATPARICNTVTASGSARAHTGIYEVRMVFTVRRGEQSAIDVVRSRQWLVVETPFGNAVQGTCPLGAPLSTATNGCL